MQVYAIVNGGTQVPLTLQPDGSYSASFTAPSESTFLKEPDYYAVSITATNDYGTPTTIDSTDTTFGDNLKLRVFESVKPVITLSGPQEGSLITELPFTISASVSDKTNQSTGYSGIKNFKLYVDGVEKSATITNDGNYGKRGNFSVTDIAEGNHSYYWTAEDNDGNTVTSTTINFTTDYALPSLTITSPSDGTKTNVNSINVSGTTDGSRIVIKVNNSVVHDFKPTGGTFEKTITLNAGSNAVVITAYDENGREYSNTINILYSSSVPVFKSVRIVPDNPSDLVNGKLKAGCPYKIIVEVV